jgi:hypothetical protein
MVYRVRKNTDPRKGLFHTVKRRSGSPKRVVQTIMNVSQTRRNRKARRKARQFRDIVEQINDPEILANIGLYVNKDGVLVSDEGSILPIQYNLLIDELAHRLDFADDEYEEKILRKAIKFITKARDAHKHTVEMDSLERMMAAL